MQGRILMLNHSISSKYSLSANVAGRPVSAVGIYVLSLFEIAESPSHSRKRAIGRREIHIKPHPRNICIVFGLVSGVDDTVI